MNIGLDVGSTTAKIIHLDDGVVVKSRVVPSHRWKELLGTENDHIVSTGYFRKRVPHDAAITEITAAIIGVRHHFPGARVIVDIGGQDTKVIDVRDNTFIINDKCSAGTGAFLELAAHYFEIPVASMGQHRADRSAPINNTCGVFAISEMISQLVSGYSMEEVIQGIHEAFARRIAQMVPDVEEIVLVGGAAMNTGIVNALGNILDSAIKVPAQPQMENALGAALYGEYQKSRDI